MDSEHMTQKHAHKSVNGNSNKNTPWHTLSFNSITFTGFTTAM